MNYISPIGKHIVSYISSSRDSETSVVSNKEMLHIATVMNNSHIDSQLLVLPKLVVVGTQSSGKSSLLNAIIGMDILPIGKTMTTRTPLHLELLPTTTDPRIEIGTYVHGIWTCDKKISITFPQLTTEQRDSIRLEIEHQTIVIAGQDLNISAIPICIKIMAPSLPLLQLVDLPGLTSVAITDKGQPKNIKDQIIQLVKQYASPPSTIIMAIIAARPDIEADMSMEIVKQLDPQGERTIGILTKVDLMNEDADIRMYLENNVSADLTLRYGYYGIRNRSQPNQTIVETILAEKNYFQSHPIYQQSHYKSRLGIPQVASSISTILIQAIKSALPGVLSVIRQKIEEKTKELSFLGSSIPANKEIRSSVLHGMITQFSKQYIQTIEMRGSGKPTGKSINETFSQFRKTIDAIQPFQHMDEAYVKEKIACYDGIHMRFPYLPIEIIEQCITDATHKPLFQLIEPAQLCAQTCVDILTTLYNELIEQHPIRKFPNLVKIIRNIMMTDILLPCYQITINRINELVECEQAYIWTDDTSFHQIISSEFSNIILANGDIDIKRYKKILMSYVTTIIKYVRHSIPKTIAYHLITEGNKKIQTILYDTIIQRDVNHLLEESPEIEQRRQCVEKQLQELQEIKLKIESVL